MTLYASLNKVSILKYISKQGFRFFVLVFLVLCDRELHQNLVTTDKYERLIYSLL